MQIYAFSFTRRGLCAGIFQILALEGAEGKKRGAIICNPCKKMHRFKSMEREEFEEGERDEKITCAEFAHMGTTRARP